MQKLILSLPLALLFSLAFACGSETDQQEEEALQEEPTLIAADQPSILTNICKDIPIPASEPQDYCRTLSSGKIYTVTLRPSTYIQNPDTCEISSPDDGLRVSMVEMGFTPCIELERDDSGVAAL